MALAQGAFMPGTAGITAPGGAYSYKSFVSYPQYYGGTFFIDTGYDDPVLWSTGVDAAEVYQARVYANSISYFGGSAAATTYDGKWHVVPTPVWTARMWTPPHGNINTQNRILIACDVYLSEPLSLTNGSWQRLETVNWSLYRV